MFMNIKRKLFLLCLRYGGKCNGSFAANFLLSPAVKEVLKSVNIFQSYA